MAPTRKLEPTIEEWWRAWEAEYILNQKVDLQETAFRPMEPKERAMEPAEESELVDPKSTSFVGPLYQRDRTPPPVRRDTVLTPPHARNASPPAFPPLRTPSPPLRPVLTSSPGPREYERQPFHSPIALHPDDTRVPASTPLNWSGKRFHIGKLHKFLTTHREDEKKPEVRHGVPQGGTKSLPRETEQETQELLKKLKRGTPLERSSPAREGVGEEVYFEGGKPAGIGEEDGVFERLEE